MIPGAAPSPPRALPAALVLGAAVRPDGSPSPALIRRVEAAAALWRGGATGVLILSGGGPPGRPAEAEVMAGLCRARGVPEEALVLDPEARSTAGNLRNARPILARLGHPPLLVVTDGWHLPRARLAARRLGLKAGGIPASGRPGLRKAAVRPRAGPLLREALALLWYALTLWR